MAKKAPTKAERDYMGRVAALGCAVCRRLGLGDTPAIVHHQRTGQGWGRASHYRTVGLCPAHHQHSGFGVHDMGRAQFEEMYGFSEVDLIEETRRTLWAYLPPGERDAA
ncbi:Ref family recombination enhancement nuclease [Burkholderia multivorans]|uniref:Ref family recombination enhancement nuclease n=1 Tax=Burkholderia multivorans TaxID=87883 RepID=UPI003BA86220